jgi:hypothetical protein
MVSSAVPSTFSAIRMDRFMVLEAMIIFAQGMRTGGRGEVASGRGHRFAAMGIGFP